jgi:dephospho-CoA kinase
MTIVGITGGIGSGKTTVCNIFSSLGVPIYHADDEAKKLYSLPHLKEELKKRFGAAIINKNGDLDKKKMADLIFNDEKSLKEINTLIHPLVIQHFNEWKEKQESTYIIKEAAILFESGTNKDCDKIILVTAPAETRMQRILQRDNRTREEVEKIMQKQWAEEEKRKLSDFIITNDETQLVIPQVLKIHSELLKLAVNK